MARKRKELLKVNNRNTKSKMYDLMMKAYKGTNVLLVITGGISVLKTGYGYIFGTIDTPSIDVSVLDQIKDLSEQLKEDKRFLEEQLENHKEQLELIRKQLELMNNNMNNNTETSSKNVFIKALLRVKNWLPFGK